MLDPVTRMLMGGIELEERERLLRYKRQWLAYVGQPDRKPLVVKPGQADDNVLINKGAVIVDKGVSFLFGQEVTFSTDDQADQESPEEAYLASVWRANRKATFLHKLALSGGIFGHCFVKLVPRQGDVPRLVSLAPEYVTPSWDDEDLEHVWRYRIQWHALDRETAKPRLRRQVLEEAVNGRSWTITDFEQRDGGAMQQTGQITWNYPFAPIVDCQNLPSPSEYWGQSDLEDDMLALGEALNFSQSNMQRIERFHGHPKTWGKGFQANQLDIGADGLIILNSPDADLKNLEMVQNLDSHLARYGKLEEAVHERGRVPAIATGKMEHIGQLSGRALTILYQPLLEKTATKRLLYGDLLSELNRRLLVLANLNADKPVEIVWPELLPGDPLEERQTALIDQQLGVASKETLAVKLGYDWEQETQRLDDEGQAALETQAAAFDRGLASPPDLAKQADRGTKPPAVFGKS